MGKINLEDIEPGMVLADDVKQVSGEILLAAGAVLTERHLQIFKKWGITEADVEGVTKEAAVARSLEQLDPELLKRVESQVATLFHWNDPKNAFIQELMRLCTLRHLQFKNEGRP
jgi:hypothetical protein